MNVGKVLGVLDKVDKVLSNRRPGRLRAAAPQPPTCGQDQRLDILIVEIRELNRSIDHLIELQSAALQFTVQHAGPVLERISTMEMLPEMPEAHTIKQALDGALEAAGIDPADNTALDKRVAEDLHLGGALKLRRRKE